MKISNNFYELFEEAYKGHIEKLDECIEALKKLRDTFEVNSKTCSFMSLLMENAEEGNNEEN